MSAASAPTGDGSALAVLITDTLGQPGLDALDAAPNVAWRMETDLSAEALKAAVRVADALIVRSGTTVDRTVIEAGERLRVIGRAGAGVDNIDLDAARQRGVVVVNTPGTNSVAAAEHALALMLAISRHIAPAHASVLAGEWRRADFVGTELLGKTLGIIGYGRIGQLVGARAAAFGMRLLAYDPFMNDDAIRGAGAEPASFEATVRGSDFLTLHAAMTDETRGMIGRQALALARPSLIVVNCARGGLIDERALYEALEKGRIRGAALDVYESEPPTGSPLIGHPRVLHVPHLGASTHEAQANVATSVVERVLSSLEGRVPADAIVG